MKSVEELIGHYLDVPSILIFPNEQLKRSFIKELQQKHSFGNHRYLTFKDLKNLLFLQSNPTIKGEKRVVALSNALSADVKKFFKLTNYLDISVFSGRLFGFFETLAEAGGLDLPERFFERTADSENQLQWQLDSYAHLVSAKDQYLALISKHGYVDNIFIDNEDICLDTISGFSRFVFVGIQNMSLREKNLLALIGEDREVIEVDPDQCLDFGENALKKCIVHRCVDSFGQLMHCANSVDRESYDVVIDLSNESERYAELLDANKFEIKYSAYFSSSKVYSVLKNLELLIIHCDGSKVDGFRLEEACSNNGFGSYYNLKKEELLKLRKKLDGGRIYFPLSSFTLLGLEQDMENVRGLKDVGSLVSFIQGLELARLLDDAFDTSLDKLFGQLFSLQQAFGSDINNKSNLKGVAWLKLLLKRCEHLQLDYDVQKDNERKLRVVNLKSAWFLEDKKIVLLNANENVLSSVPPKVYLLTEKQLKELGATTRDDYNEEQRQQFMQLCLRNNLVKIYSVDSASEGKQTSSFVEELVLGLPARKVSQEIVKSDSYYSQYLEEVSSDIGIERKLGLIDLIRIEEKDFGEALVISPSSFDSLKACPLKHYLDKQVRLTRTKLEESVDIKDNVLGNVVHDIFGDICMLMKKYAGKDISYKEALTTINIDQVISQIFARNVDLLPKVYHQDYAEQVIFPVLKESIKTFFVRTCESKFALKEIKFFYVEDEGIAKGDKIQISTMVVGSENIPIKIIGRADVRFELFDGRVFIFDFKTGTTMHDEQLNFYSKFYYEGRPGNEEIKPHLYFYKVFDMQEKQAKYVDIDEKVNKVCSSLSASREYDFAVTTGACRYCDHEGVCRKNG